MSARTDGGLVYACALRLAGDQLRGVPEDGWERGPPEDEAARMTEERKVRREGNLPAGAGFFTLARDEGAS